MRAQCLGARPAHKFPHKSQIVMHMPSSGTDASGVSRNLVRPGGTLSSMLLPDHPAPAPVQDEARLPHHPGRPLKASEHHLEPHVPGAEHVATHFLGAAPAASRHHAGIPCEELPPSHTHALPDCGSLPRRNKTSEGDGKEPATPPATPLTTAEDTAAEGAAGAETH